MIALAALVSVVLTSDWRVVEVTVVGKRVKAFVDTGAATTWIDEGLDYKGEIVISLDGLRLKLKEAEKRRKALGNGIGIALGCDLLERVSILHRVGQPTRVGILRKSWVNTETLRLTPNLTGLFTLPVQWSGHSAGSVVDTGADVSGPNLNARGILPGSWFENLEGKPTVPITTYRGPRDAWPVHFDRVIVGKTALVRNVNALTWRMDFAELQPTFLLGADVLGRFDWHFDGRKRLFSILRPQSDD